MALVGRFCCQFAGRQWRSCSASVVDRLFLVVGLEREFEFARELGMPVVEDRGTICAPLFFLLLLRSGSLNRSCGTSVLLILVQWRFLLL